MADCRGVCFGVFEEVKNPVYYYFKKKKKEITHGKEGRICNLWYKSLRVCKGQKWYKISSSLGGVEAASTIELHYSMFYE